MVKKYYQLDQNSAENADLYIFGDICSWPWEEYGEKSGYSIVKDLQAVEARAITVHINSYGGDVAEGLAIYNVLKNCGKDVTTIVDGFACSAASVVFMAGAKRIMNPASLLMIHNAWTYAYGNAEELRKMAEDLEIITQASVEAYKERASIPEEEIKRLMDEETWILPATAVEYGLATEIAEEKTEGVQQSAFRAIMKRLTETPEGTITVNVDMDEAAIAKAVADMLEERGFLIGRQAETDEHQEEEDLPANSWERFFEKGK